MRCSISRGYKDGEIIGRTEHGSRVAAALRCGRADVAKSLGHPIGIVGNGPPIRLCANNEPAQKLVKVT
jgi:hypothetical protein